MLEKIDLGKSMDREEYKTAVQPLKDRLAMLQHEMREKNLPVIILFEGWGAAGKGSKIADVIQNLDPRSFKVFSTVAPTVEEQRKPFLWRHWQRLPKRGQMVILDRSWYPEVSVDRVEKQMGDGEARRRMESVNTFERQLTDDGYLILKFFLHVSQKEQKKRLEKLAKSKETAWRVTKADWHHNKNYNGYLDAFDDMIDRTDKPNAPWHVVGCNDKSASLFEIYSILVSDMQSALDAKNAKESGIAAPSAPKGGLSGGFPLVAVPRLADVRLDTRMDPDEYTRECKALQKRIGELHNILYLRKVPVIVAYEGWDAAGKGGNIKRMTKPMDPRGYEVVPIAAPTPDELAHQYLWRFWTQLPKNGHVTVFDRTWYGRVMVERIEGFCSVGEWQRAYREINEFEKELHGWGAVILKFWLQIDADEQLRRFTDRQNTPEKQWKITAEDWRNREKWPQYEEAVNDLLMYTSTKHAPWSIIASQDKKTGRLQAMEAFIRAVEKRLR